MEFCYYFVFWIGFREVLFGFCSLCHMGCFFNLLVMCFTIYCGVQILLRIYQEGHSFALVEMGYTSASIFESERRFWASANFRLLVLKNLKLNSGQSIVSLNVKLTVVEGYQKAPFSEVTTPRCRGGHYSFPWIAPLYPWYVPYIAVLSKEVSSTIFKVFGMTWPVIEPRSPGPLANILFTLGAITAINTIWSGLNDIDGRVGHDQLIGLDLFDHLCSTGRVEVECSRSWTAQLLGSCPQTLWVTIHSQQAAPLEGSYPSAEM